MHPRRQIIENVREALLTVKEFKSIRNTRQTVLGQHVGPAFPCVTFYAENESNEVLTIHPEPIELRQTAVAVRVWIMGTTEIEYAEKQIDIQCERVEEAMWLRFWTPDDELSCRLVGTDFDAAEDEPLLHVVTLTYQLDYQG